MLHCFNYTDKAVILAKLACYFKNNIKISKNLAAAFHDASEDNPVG